MALVSSVDILPLIKWFNPIAWCWVGENWSVGWWYSWYTRLRPLIRRVGSDGGVWSWVSNWLKLFILTFFSFFGFVACDEVIVIKSLFGSGTIRADHLVVGRYWIGYQPTVAILYHCLLGCIRLLEYEWWYQFPFNWIDEATCPIIFFL